MSVVIAIKSDGVVYMGADSCTSSYGGDSKDNTALGGNAKIVKRDDGLLIGTVGKCSQLKACIYNDELFQFDEGEKLTKKWIVTKFLPKLREALQKDNMLAPNGSFEFSLILAKGDALYKMTGEQYVYEVNDYVVAGSGGAPAIATIANKNQPIEDRVLTALRSAAQFDAYVSAPFVLYNTKDLEYREVKA